MTPDWDVVVVGGGMAGHSAAVAAAAVGATVCMVSKVPVHESHSAQGGGMNGTIGDRLDWRVHAADTVKGSDYLADQDAVRVMCRDASAAILELDALGATFRREQVGRYGRSGYHVPDITGYSALDALNRQLISNPATTVVEGRFAVALLRSESGRCTGVLVIEEDGDDVAQLTARTVVLATGGAGQMYSPTTNASICTGDGVALAWQAGAALADLEMVQYHPTALTDGTLVSESARGGGAQLLNADGERFMHRYAPNAAELAPRDIVSRAIHREVAEGRGTAEGAVLLDFAEVPRSMFDMPHLQKMAADCAEVAGVDITRDPVPVRPAAHYWMGGIRTDVDGRTSVAGLFAAGESACVSVHGANRLGGNSLLEARVFGRRAGLHAAFEAKASARLDDAGDVVTDIPAIRDHVDAAGRRGDMMTTALRRELGQVMDRFAGAERDAAGLAEAAQRLDHLGGERDGNPSGAGQGDTVARLELDNLLSLARLVVASATVRRESRGAHFRRDHPRRNDATWLYHTILTRVDGDHQQSVERIPVRVDEWSPQVRSY